MILLLLFSFLAGIVTILSPCILPIAPIVLSGSVAGKKRPFGIVIGFVLSFTFFTLFLSTLVKATGVSADVLRNISVFIILGFGISLLFSRAQVVLEKLFAKLSSRITYKNTNEGFLSGILIGLSLGLVWTPCVGPIIASVIALAATNTVTSSSALIIFSYSLGTAIPMFVVMFGGRTLLQKHSWFLRNSSNIQKAFGILMILTAIAIFFNVDRKFQVFILEKFPWYGAGITKIEDNAAVRERLKDLKNPQKARSSILDNNFQNAPELISGGQWFNLPAEASAKVGTQPLFLKDLRGKVVLVDFWTYTCINCIRTLPYIQSWHEKYKDKGLVIIGVHTPEFEFEKNPQNLQKAIDDFGLTYPIMQDNDYATWLAYDNHYWPAKYFIDKNGKVRSHHFGEGSYDESEKLIQELLMEAGSFVNVPISNPSYNIYSQTPETYLGYARIANFASRENIAQDQEKVYSAPPEIKNNEVEYSGIWNVAAERAVPEKGSSLVLSFEAKEVFLVMRSRGNASGRIRVLIDGKQVDLANAGEDVVDGLVNVRSDRLYRLIKLKEPGKHILKLEFLDGNLELYAFTFG